MIIATVFANYPNFSLTSDKVWFDGAIGPAPARAAVTFEGGCRDQGAVRAGLIDPYALNRLCIIGGSKVKIVDDYRNQQANEVVYVYQFGLSSDSTLDLNGKKLFWAQPYLACANGVEGTVVRGGGQITQIEY